MKRNLSLFLIALAFALTSCTSKNNQKSSPERESNRELAFESRKLVNNARYWWGVTVGDITNDGLMDVVFIDNNSSGGFLGYYSGQTEEGLWQMTQIAEAPPGGGTFASGDLETGDMDGDGDQDYDIFRLPGHEATDYFLLENRIK